MGRIAQLDSQTANMIAAGEVVERPMGVVKELVENAIDAGSTRISITIEEGGLSKITVSDNGCGMDASDAEMCFARHATSKIHAQNDLWAIRTLGFRGEALPSIASVAKVTLSTSDGKDATRIVMSYGKKEKAVPYPCSQGTEITVEGLFYQTPARLKHMRSSGYEGSLIQDVISRFALSHPEIAFHLIHDGRDAFRTSGQGDLLEVLYAVYGKAAAENAIPVDFSDYDYHVHGYLVKPIITRASRSMMHIFLNGRMVRTYKLYQSVQDGYEDFIPKGRYPMCVLSVEMDPHLLDVNVHPSKWEVRISKEVQLELLIKENTRKTLQGNTIVPEKKIEEVRTEYYQPLSFDTDELQTSVQKTEGPEEKEAPMVLDEETRTAIAKEAQEDNAFLQSLQQRVEETHSEYTPKEADPFPLMEVIGQYKDSYILCSCEKGLAVIDQKAAQDRIEYEKLVQTLNGKPVTMELLIPVTINVSDDVIKRIDEVNLAMQDLHIVFEEFGRNTLMVRSVPSWMQDLNMEEFLHDMIDASLLEKDTAFAKTQKNRIAAMASKRSVHAHQKLNDEEMIQIVNALGNCENPWNDPSGRTTFILLEEKELMKGLGR